MYMWPRPWQLGKLHAGSPLTFFWKCLGLLPVGVALIRATQLHKTLTVCYGYNLLLKMGGILALPSAWLSSELVLVQSLCIRHAHSGRLTSRLNSKVKDYFRVCCVYPQNKQNV